MVYYYVCNTCKNIYMFNSQVKYCPNFNCAPIMASKEMKTLYADTRHLCKLTMVDECLVSIINRLHKRKVYVAGSNSGLLVSDLGDYKNRTGIKQNYPYLDIFTYTPPASKFIKALEEKDRSNKKTTVLKLQYQDPTNLPLYDSLQTNNICRIELRKPVKDDYITNRYDFILNVSKALDRLGW